MALLNEDLVFDDRIQDDLPGGTLSRKPFYADVLKRWMSDNKLTKREQRIVTNIVVFYPDYLPDNCKSEEFIELIREALQEPDLQDPSNPEKGLFLYTLFYLMLLQRKWTELASLIETLEEYFVSFYNNIGVCQVPGKSNCVSSFFNKQYTDISVYPAPYEKSYIEIVSRIMSLGEVTNLKPGFDISLLPVPSGIKLGNCNGHSLRGQALELYHCEEYDKASAVYRKMLAFKFEMPGTLAHLARLEMTRGNLDQAEIYIVNGWKLRHEAPSYVLVRILYLIVFMNMLRSYMFGQWLGCLKEVMSRPDSKLQWDMDRLLDRYKKDVITDYFSLLKVLLKVLSGEDDGGELNKNEMWKEVTPIVFEAWPDYDDGWDLKRVESH
jgi:hypothetical protein